MHVFYSAFTNISFESYLARADQEFAQHDPYAEYPWNHRTVDITTDPLIAKIQHFLEQRLNCTLTLSSAEIQIWPVGAKSLLHKHTSNGKEGTDYNSLLYLNDDFFGGEFYTEYGLSFKPKQGMLTFFNGKEILHGLKDVDGRNRYTIILWWQNTKFNYNHE